MSHDAIKITQEEREKLAAITHTISTNLSGYATKRYQDPTDNHCGAMSCLTCLGVIIPPVFLVSLMFEDFRNWIFRRTSLSNTKVTLAKAAATDIRAIADRVGDNDTFAGKIGEIKTRLRALDTANNATNFDSGKKHDSGNIDGSSASWEKSFFESSLARIIRYAFGLANYHAAKEAEAKTASVVKCSSNYMPLASAPPYTPVS